MTKQTQHLEHPDPKANRILQRLDSEDYDALMARAKVVSLKFRKRLYRQDQAVDAVYFPLTSMVSLLVSSDGQPRMEMATVGWEGVVGAAELLQEQGAMGLNHVQIPGAAVKIKADSFLKEVSGRPGLERAIHTAPPICAHKASAPRGRL